MSTVSKYQKIVRSVVLTICLATSTSVAAWHGGGWNAGYHGWYGGYHGYHGYHGVGWHNGWNNGWHGVGWYGGTNVYIAPYPAYNCIWVPGQWWHGRWVPGHNAC